MTDLVIGAGDSLDPESIQIRTFGQARKGYDPREVRHFLDRVAESARHAQARIGRLEARIVELEGRLASRVIDLDEDELMVKLGEETTRVLRSAREAAADLYARAEERAQSLRQSAQDEAAEARQSAATWADETRRSADTEATEVRRAAAREALQEMERSKEIGRAMVEEAKAVRERVISELQRRRELAAEHVAQLHRERQALRSSLESVQSLFDDMGRELDDSAYVMPPLAELLPEPSGHRLRRSHDDAPAHALGAGAPEQAVADSVVAMAETSVDESGEFVDDAESEATEVAVLVEVATVVVTAVGDEATTDEWADTAGFVTEADAEDANEWLAESASDEPAPADGEVAPDAYAAGLAANADAEDIAADAEDIAVDADEAASADSAEDDVASADNADEAAASAENADEAPGDDVADEAPDAEPDERRSREVRQVAGATHSADVIDAIFARIKADRQEDRRVVRESKEAVAQLDSQPGSRGGGASVLSLATGNPITPGVPRLPEDFDDGRWHDDDLDDQDDDDTELDLDTGPVAVQAAPVVELAAWRSPTTANDRAKEARDEAVGAVGDSLTRRLKRVLQDEQNRLLEAIGHVRKPDDWVDLLPTATRLRAEWAEEPVAALVEAAAAGWQEGAGSDLGGEPTDVPLADLVELIASQVLDPLASQLSRIRPTEIDVDQVVEGVGAAFREARSLRVEPVVLAAVSAAYCRGLYLAAPESAHFRWVVDHGGAPSPDCDDNALSAPVGRDVSFPTGHLYPPVHERCRCLVVPVD